MSFIELVQEHGAELTKADNAVVQALLADPTGAPFLAGEEVSRRADVHPSSATRLAKKLGFAGYPALRAQLQAELQNDIRPSQRVQASLEQAAQSTVLAELVTGELDALSAMLRSLSQDRINEVAQLIARARRVYLFGHGNAVVLVELMHRRLRRFGLDSVQLVGNGRDLAEHLLGLGTQDVVLAFGFRKPSFTLPRVLAHAKEVGATTVLITDVLAAIEPAPTVTIAAARGDGHRFQSLTVPMAITNAIVLTIAATVPGSSLSSLDQLPELIDYLSPDR